MGHENRRLERWNKRSRWGNLPFCTWIRKMRVRFKGIWTRRHKSVFGGRGIIFFAVTIFAVEGCRGTARPPRQLEERAALWRSIARHAAS